MTWQKPNVGSEENPVPSLNGQRASISGVAEDVTAHGAVGDGSTDDSAAIQSAIDAVKGQGGEVLYPAGKNFVAEGLEYHPDVTHRALGKATLSLPSSPSNHLFVANSVDLDTAKVVGLELDGGGTTTYDALHLDSANKYEDGGIMDCYIHDFRRGYSGSLNDRQNVIENTRINLCEVGIYINGNHPQIDNCDLRDNTTGLGGDLYDVQIDNTRIVYNDYGVRGLDGGAINNCHFDNCMWFRNTNVDLELGELSKVTDSMFASGSSSTKGVVVNGPHAKVKDNVFRDVSINTYSDAAIVLDVAQGVNIDQNEFYRVGTCIRATTNANGDRALNISGGNARLSNSADQFFVNETTLYTPRIEGVSMVVSVNPSNTIFDVGDCGGFGFQFLGNTVYGETGSGTYLAGDADNAIIKNNNLRRITTQSITGTPTANADNTTTS